MGDQTGATQITAQYERDSKMAIFSLKRTKKMTGYPHEQLVCANTPFYFVLKYSISILCNPFFLELIDQQTDVQATLIQQ